MNPRVLKGALLEVANVNFHPAPPRFPGRGGVSYALFEKETEYGATAHALIREIDAGEIFSVWRFPIFLVDTVESVFYRAEVAGYHLFLQLISHYLEHGKLPAPCGETWYEKTYTRKEFQQFLHLDLTKPAEMRAKIKATQHSQFPNAYIEIDGLRFRYSKT